MNALLPASLLALSFAASGALAQDHAARINSFGIGAASMPGMHAGHSANSWQSLTGPAPIHKRAAQADGVGMRLPFASFRIADNLGVRVGRIGLPVFLTASHCNLCRLPTVAAPGTAMYPQVLLHSAYHIDASWRRAYTGIGVWTQLAIGASGTTPAGGFGVRHNKAWL